MGRALPALAALTALAAAVAVAFVVPTYGAAATATGSTVATRHSCAAPLWPGAPVCFALVRTDVPAVRADALSPNATPAGYGPSDLQSAYALPSASGGAGQTVALTELADDPNLESDLGTYRAQFGLPACTTANGCFRKVNGSGQQGNYPPGDTGWGGEASLDVDMVSAICPNCHILVVESGDLDAAQNTAVSLGARYISNSWGTGDGSGDNSNDVDFNHSGVVEVASSGDGGFGVSYPATSRFVVAAGGTTLRRATGTSRGWSETAWSGSGSGCSSFEAKPSWQHDTGCGGRTVADVSAEADPGTAVAVFDSFGQGGWELVGGTSASSPIIASTYALAGNPPTSQAAASSLYANSGSLNDVTSGANGSCSPSYLCTAGAGYDGPTGLGTPRGTGAFGGTSSSPTAAALVGTQSGRCLDTFGGTFANGTKEEIWDCDSGAGQSWTLTSSGQLTVDGGAFCLDDNGWGTAPGTVVDLWSCDGGANQQWTVNSNGTVVGVYSGLCLDVFGQGTGNGTQVGLWTCNGQQNQQWRWS